MLNKKLQKTLNSLIQLKVNQQDRIREEIANINGEKESKLAEINLTQDQIYKNSNNMLNKKTNFYNNLDATIFSHKEVYSFRIDIEKLNAKHHELVDKCKAFSTELITIDERLQEKQQQLKALIIKEEKYRYITSIAARQTY